MTTHLHPQVLSGETEAMIPGAMIPLAAFVMVVLIVAIVQMAKLRDKEVEVQQRLHMEELDHRRKMQELEMKAQSLRGSV